MTTVVWILTNGNYEVSSLKHFRCIEGRGLGFLPSGSVPSNYWSSSYIQTTNIDFTGETMTPIGISSTDYFTGSYDGQNYELQNWQNDQNSTSSYQGIFGYINNTSSILKNINITGLTIIKGNTSCGILCGYGINCKISNINMNLSINSSLICTGQNIGSICGFFSGSVMEKIRIRGYLTVTGWGYTGGVCGYLGGSGIIRDIILSTTGNFSGTSNVLGGILGFVNSTTMTVNGLINEMQGNITSTAGNVGGIVGAGGYIYSCINKMKGNISGTTPVGGIVGNTGYSVEDNINIMEGNIIYSSITNTGGILGYTITANQSIKRNLIAMKGDTPAGICYTYGATPSLANNIFSNRFGMTINGSITSTSTTNNGTYVTLSSYPTTELTVTSSSGINKTWNSYKYLPILTYTYTDILSISQTITSDTTYLPEVNWIYNSLTYEVSSLDHLRCIASMGLGFNITGSPPSSYLTVSYIQTANIDCNGYIMTPIGNSTNYFTGSYDGQNFEIQNWQNDQSFAVVDTAYSNQGIFGYINNSISILKNIKITGLVKVAGYHTCGILCGSINYSKITNININLSLGSIINSAGANHGSVIGACYGVTVEKIRVTGYLSITGTSVIGGAIGYATNTAPSIIRDIIISTTGNFTQTDGYAGGIIAYSASTTTTINGLINEIIGDITSSNSTYVGGIIGRAYSPIYSCVNRMKGNLSGTDQVGGIVGNTNATVEDNMNIMEGDIIGSITTTYCGGIGYSSLFSHKRNLVAIKGNISAIICGTLTTTTNVLNNVFSNRFGMTVNGVVNATNSSTNGTYVTLDSFPTSSLTVTSSSGINKTWNSYKYLPILTYSYTDILTNPQTILSDTTNLPEVNWIFNSLTYEVSSILHLRCIASMGIGFNIIGSPPPNYLTASYLQTANIDCTGYIMTPIGNYTSNYQFTGSYDGGNYEIQNWQNTSISTFNQGIFSCINNTNSVLKNINITGLIKVYSSGNSGILCGLLYNGKISNITMNLLVNSILTSTGTGIGSIVGYFSSGTTGIIEKIRIKGYLTISGVGYTGGVCGNIIGTGSIRDIILSTIGDINSSSTNTGGILGYIGSTMAVNGLINEMQGDIISTTLNVGGIVGAGGYIYSCINRMRGNIQGTVSIGGIVGNTTYSVEDNINIMTGNIIYTTSITNTGGIIGSSLGSSQSIKRNLVAMKGNTPSGICYTYGTGTTNIVNNVFSNRFSMTINTAVTIISTLNNGTYITLNSYPTTELTVTSSSGINKIWDSTLYLPVWTYTYNNILSSSQTIISNTTIFPTINWVLNIDGISYEVSSLDHFICISKQGIGYITTGSVPSDYLSASYIQTINIDFNGIEMIPIGDAINLFTGNYNGQNFELQNWQNNQSNLYDNQGIFGFISNINSIIKNISITGLIKVTANNCCGILVGYLKYGKISNINLNLLINSSLNSIVSSVGGLIGYVQGSSIYPIYIEKIRIKGYLIITNTLYTGGLIGRIFSTAYIQDIIISTVGDINGTDHIAGIIGSCNSSATTSTLYGCISEIQGNIIGNDYVGGIVGYSAYPINTCINRMTGNIIGNNYVGGIIGYNTDLVSNNINIMKGNIIWTNISNISSFGGIGYTTDTLKRNIVAINGELPYILNGSFYNNDSITEISSGISINNIFSNRFGMSLSNDNFTTKVNLDLYPITELSTLDTLKYWDSDNYLPYWNYSYTDIMGTSQLISSNSKIITWVLNNGSYEVSSLDHFRCIEKKGVGYITSGDIPSNYWSASYIQTKNIDFNAINGIISEPMTPIGISNTNYFTGSYDGQNFELQNWQNDQNSVSSYQGIFGCIDNSSSILKNISITGTIKVKGSGTCAILCGGFFNGKISNINMNLSVNSILTNAATNTGALVGYLIMGTTGIIEKIRVKGYLNISGTLYIGGICGYITGNGSIKDIIFSIIGNINGSGNVLGGILGYINSTTIVVGGLINEMQGNISGNQNIGGIIGTSNSSIYSCMNRMKGNITGDSCVGGIVGNCSGSIEDNINIMEGNITYTTITNTGGIIGYTITVNQSIKRNLVAIKGNTPSGICYTLGATPSLANNVFSNRFGMTINNLVTTANSTNNGTYVTLSSYPTTELTTTGYIKYWNSSKYVPVWSYTYTDIFSVSQTITSDKPDVTGVVWILTNGNYEVSSLDHFRCIEKKGIGYITSGDVPVNYWSSSYIQTINIDFTGQVMTPIGISSSDYFTGNYDGQNFELQNWQNDQSSTSDYQGIFGYINNSSSIIKNISITGLIKVKGKNYCGILCGNCITGKIYNIFMNLPLNSILNAYGYAGSLVGHLNSGTTIQKIRLTGYLTVTTTTNDCTGGVIGWVDINSSSNTYIKDIIISTVGNITGINYTGGIIGADTANGGVAGKSLVEYGSLINEIQGNISGSDRVGGIIGYSVSVVSSTINRMKGNITSTSNTGGIIGYVANTTLSDNINVMEGNITGTTNYGGLFGYRSATSISITRNIVAIKGNTGASANSILSTTIVDTASALTVSTNIFSNRFGMTVNSVQVTSNTYVTYNTLDSLPSGFTGGTILTFNSTRYLPIWSYTYTDILNVSQTITSITTYYPEVNWVYNGSTYEVSSINHLRCIASMGSGLNITGTPPPNYLIVSYIQTQNIDCNGYIMIPIGISNSYPFTGNYNGQNYEIQNWQNNQSSTSNYQSIFGYVSGSPSTLINISITGLVKVSGIDSCSILCAEIYNNGKISNITLNLSKNSSLIGRQYNGSILGVSRGCTIEKIRVKGYLTITTTGQYNGGIVGYAGGVTIFRDIILSIIGNITGTGNILGGILGYVNNSTCTISGLINEMQGNIINTSTNVGGVIGACDSSIYCCMNRMKGNIQGTNNIGGITGYCIGSSIQDNINVMEGNIIYTTSITNTGGILGFTNVANQSIIRNVVSMKGNTPSGICYTYSATPTTTNNVFSNRFGMTINNVVTSTTTTNNGTYITLNSYPITELTTTGYIKYWDSIGYKPYWTYTYTDIFGISQSISSIPNYGFHLDFVRTNNQGLLNSLTNDIVFYAVDSIQKLQIGCGSNNYPRLTFTSNNTGISNINPITSLDINTTDALKIPVGTIEQRPIIGSNGMIRYNTTIGKYECYSNNNWSDIILMNNNNYVGINNLNPQYTLDINGSTNISTNLYVNSKLGIGTINPQYSLDVNGSTNINNNLYVTTKVGVGTTNPQYSLDVRGITNISSNLYISNGNLGIGTTTTLYTLDTKGVTNISSNLYVGEKLNVGYTTDQYISSIVDRGLSNLSVPISGTVSVITNYSPFSFSNDNNSKYINVKESIYTNNNSNNYIQFINNQFQFNWWTIGFTTEAWINLKSYGTFNSSYLNIPSFVGVMNTVGNIWWSFGNTSTGKLSFYYFTPTVASYIIGSTTLNLNEWYHIAVTCTTGGVISLWLNGVVEITATVSGTPQVSNVLTICRTNIGGINTYSDLYFRDLRITQSCLYTTSFIPPKEPLTPSMTVYTLLLLQTSPVSTMNNKGSLNANSIYNMQVNNIEDFEFPPSAMTGSGTTNNYTTVCSDGLSYTVTCSSEDPFSSVVFWQCWNAFNKLNSLNDNSDSSWHAKYAIYTNNGWYNSTQFSTVISGTTVYGEWIQLQMQNSIILTKYRLYARINASSYIPTNFYLVGSLDGSTWTTIDYQENVYMTSGYTFANHNSYINFYLSNNTTAYKYFRIVVTKCDTNSWMAIGEIVFYGKKTIANQVRNASILRTITTNDLNVGIGTTNPKGRLHIVNPHPYDETLILGGGASTNFNGSQIRFCNGNLDYSHFIGSRHNAGDVNGNSIDFYCATSNQSNNIIGGSKFVMSIIGSGNVGIGLTNPSYALDISSDSVRKITTNTWTFSSDKRIKEDIVIADYNICYNVLSNLDLKYFEWTNNIKEYTELSDRHVLGWIADDVELYLPKAVIIEKERYGLSNFKSLNIDQIYANMYGAIKKIMSDIEELELKNLKYEEILNNLL